MIRSLKVRCKGLDVKAVQDALNYRRKPGDEFLVLDGDFGTHTRAAVVRFQADHGLDPDGVVGHWTRQALFPLMTFSCYLAVSRSGQDYPVATRAFNRGSAFGDAKAKGSTEGDLPEPVPVPNQILPNLKFPNDPADGPMKTLGLGGFSLPAPSLPESIFGLPQDSGQVQAGGQFVTRHLWQSAGILQSFVRGGARASASLRSEQESGRTRGDRARNPGTRPHLGKHKGRAGMGNPAFHPVHLG